MLSSVVTQALISFFIFISLSRIQIQSENEVDHSFVPSTPLTTAEIAEDVTDQNLNWNCARLKALRNVEKFFNMTEDSNEANVNREEYHSRVKRCTEKEKQNRIMREFERRVQKQEMRGDKLRETHHRNNIRKTTIHESATQKYYNQNMNEDSTPMDDLLYQTSYLENTEPYSRKYRTLPVNVKPSKNDLSSTSFPQNTESVSMEPTEPHSKKYRTLPVNSKSFRNDLSSASFSQNYESLSTEPSSFINSVGKSSEIIKEDERNMVRSQKKNSFFTDSIVSEPSFLSTAPDTTPRIKAKQHNKNYRQLRPTKVTENDGKRKGLLKTLLGQVSEVMEGGTLKNAADLDKSELKEKNSSTTSDEENIEYESVTPHKFFDHFTKLSSEILSSARSRDHQENLLIQKIREDTKKELQSKIEELEKLREKIAEIIRQQHSTKNRTTISPLSFDKTSAKHVTKITDGNFNHQSDQISTQIIERNQKNTQNSIQKAATTETPSKDLLKQYFTEKHTTLSSLAPIQSSKTQEKSTSESQFTLKNLPTERIEFHNLQTTVLPSSEIYSSKHHHTNHISINQNQKNSALQARSEADENLNHHTHITQKASSTDFIKQREHSPKYDSTSSMINEVHTQTEQTQKQLHQIALSSERSAITETPHLRKNKPEVLFQTSSTKVPSLSTTLRHGTLSEEPSVVEFLHSDKRSTPQTSQLELPTTKPIGLSEERTTSPEHSLYDEITTIHFHTNHEKDPKSSLTASEKKESETARISQQRKASEESTTSPNYHTTKNNFLMPSNGDNTSSGLVGKSHSSVDDHLQHIHHPTMIPKSTAQLLLEKITQVAPFYKVEEWKKIITPTKHKLDEISTHQPIRTHEDISHDSTKKSHISSTILPLIHHHSHYTDSIASQPSDSLLKEPTHQKSSKLNIKHLDKSFTPSSPLLVEVTLPTKPHTENLPVHQQTHHHPFHLTETPLKRITLEKTLRGSSSTSDGVHSTKFKVSDENFTPNFHLPTEMISPMKTHIENHQVYQPNHHHTFYSTQMPLKKIIIEKTQEHSTSPSHLLHSPKFKSDENFTPYSTHLFEITSPIQSLTKNHPVHQENHHLSHWTEVPTKKITLEKTVDQSSSTSSGIHSSKIKASNENSTPHPHLPIEVTLPMKSHTENHPVHQQNHHHPFHSTEVPWKKVTLKKTLDQSSSTSRGVHLSKLKTSDENFNPYPLSIEVTLPTKLHTENHQVHQPNHHQSHSTLTALKKITLEKSQEDSSPTSHLVHSQKFKSDENFTPHSTHLIRVTSSMKPQTEDNPVHHLNHDHSSHSIEMPLKKITQEKVREESSTSHSVHSQKFRYDENFTPHPHFSFQATSSMKSQIENNPVYQSYHHHHPSHLKKYALEKVQDHSSSTSHEVHSPKFKSLEENFTAHPTHIIEVTSPMKSYTDKNPHDHELPKFDQISTHQPFHLIESFLKKATSPEKIQDESSSSSHSVHPHSKSKHMQEISTTHPLHPTETRIKVKSHSENQLIPLHSEKTSTNLPYHSTKINFGKIYSPQNSQKITHITSLPQSSTTGIKDMDTHPLNILEEIKRLEKQKMEEIKNLQKKQIELLHKNNSHYLPHTTLSDSKLNSEQETKKHPIIDSTSLYKGTHSTESAVQGRSNSELSGGRLHTHDITRPYPTHSSTTISPNHEMVETAMPLPPLNPNDNWKYLKKLDEWYEKQKAKKSSTPKPPTIRPSSAVVTPRPQIVPSSTTAPTTIPPRARPTTPSRNRTSPNQKPSSTVTPTTTQKPPPPVNYHINSTIHRTYNIAFNIVTPDSEPREDEERNENEVVDDPYSDFNKADFENDFNPSIDIVRSTGPPKIGNESMGDFDSLPHPSLPRELPSLYADLSNASSMDETTPLPSSFITPTSLLQTITSLRNDSLLTSHPSENNTILQSSIRSDTKRPKHLATAATLHKKMHSTLKNPPLKVQTDSTTLVPTSRTIDGKTDLVVLPHPISFVGNCTPACNNYIIIVPNKTEEIIQILHKNDQTPTTDQAVLVQAPRSGQNDHTSNPNFSSSIKSLLEPIIKAKMTPSNNTELRNSISELIASLKKRRFNEYAKLYQNRLNPIVGEGRDSIVAISQINEYIELLELMFVYLARDPDKLLDEKKDARIHNFESPYPKEDPQRRLIEDQFHYVHPKILNEFIDVYKKYSKGERYYGRPSWQFIQENDQRAGPRARTSDGFLSNLFNFKGLVQPLIYNTASMDRPDTRYYDY